jgi:hypothetical protein
MKKEEGCQKKPKKKRKSKRKKKKKHCRKKIMKRRRKKKKKVKEKNAPSFFQCQEKFGIFFLATFQDDQMHYARKKKVWPREIFIREGRKTYLFEKVLASRFMC